MTEKKVMKLASRGKRFGAACIDMALPVVAYFVFVISMVSSGNRMNSPYYGYGFDDPFGYGYGYGYGYGSGMGRGTAFLIVFVCILLIAFEIVEMVFYAKSKSIGKAILGLQVVSSKDGSPLRFWNMMLREWIVKQADQVFLLGFIWVLIDDKNRGWHDKILDTYVVDVKESEALRRKRERERAAILSFDVPDETPAEAPAAPAPRIEEVAAPAPRIEEVAAPAPRIEEAAEPAPRIEEVAEPEIKAETEVEAAEPVAQIEESAAEEVAVAEAEEAMEEVAEAEAEAAADVQEEAPAESAPQIEEASAEEAETAEPEVAADVREDVPEESASEKATAEEASVETAKAAMPKKPVIRLDIDDPDTDD